MQVIDPERLDQGRSVEHQITKQLDFYLKLGHLTQAQAMAIYYEWVVLERFDTGAGDEAEAWLNGID